MWISHWVDFASCVLMGTFGSCASVSQDLSQWFGKIDAEDTFCPLAPPPPRDVKWPLDNGFQTGFHI